jgi:hypothetical protein
MIAGTKYNIEDVVWIMIRNKATKVRVREIIIIVTSSRVTINYQLTYTGFWGTKEVINESQIHPTKEALLKSL